MFVTVAFCTAQVEIAVYGLASVTEFYERNKQGYGVCSAAECNNNLCSWREQAVF
jgi:hypothetical protein